MSTAALTVRLRKLHILVDRMEKARSEHVSAQLQTSIPGRDRWPKFAAQTWISTGDEGGNKIVPFIPYDYQEDLIRRIEASPVVQTLKSRQLGISETVCSYLACRATTEPGFVAVIISKSQSDSSELARRVKFMVDSMLSPELEYTSDNLTRLAWRGRGTLHFLAAGDAAGRGIPACAVLFLDEAAFIENVAQIYQGATGTMTMLGGSAKTIINSTPTDETSWYGQKWHDGIMSDWYDYVERGEFAELQAKLDALDTDWCRVVLHYSMHPIYSKQPGWANNIRTTRKLTQNQWDAEFELKFGSASSVIYKSALIKRAVAGEFLDCGLVGRNYTIGVDTNGGGDDYFTALVLDTTDEISRVVHIYREHFRSTPYSVQKVLDLVDYFNPTSLVIERNSMGAVIEEQFSSALPHLEVEGIYMSRPTKNRITDNILYMLENSTLQFPDGIVPQELRSFRVNARGVRTAPAGQHDDTVLALALACTKATATFDLNAVLQKL